MVYFGWLLCFLLFLGLETAFGCLVSLWFAVGALGGWAAAVAGASFEGQLAVFVAVSFAALFLIRPLAFLFGRKQTGK